MTGVQRWRRTSEVSPCAVTSCRWCPGYASCATMAGMPWRSGRGVAARSASPVARVGRSDIEAAALRAEDRSAAARRRRTAPARRERPAWRPPRPAPRGWRPGRAPPRSRAPDRARPDRRSAIASAGGASFRSASTSSRQGRASSRPASAASSAGGLLLQVEAVAPELGRAGHERVLVMQPAAELLFADREGLGVGGRLDLVAERGAEPLERLERRARAAACSSSWSPGASAPSVAASCTTSSPPPPSMPSALSTKTDGGSSQGGPRLRRGSGGGSEPLERRGRAAAGRLVVAGQDGVETLEEVGQPEDRDSGCGAARAPAGRCCCGSRPGARCGRSRPAGPRLQLLHRAGDRPKRGQVLPHRLRVETAEPGVMRHQPGRAAAAGSKWYLRSR